MPKRIENDRKDGWIDYTYDSSGKKCFVQHNVKNSPTVTNDYVDNKIYENGALKMILNSEGYVAKENGVYQYYYYLKDHLGSNRVVMDAWGNAVQVTNYYAFGASMAEVPRRYDQDKQLFKYNGKELDRMMGLDLYDYGARQYDPIMCSFTTPDPLCEKYYSISPYSYCLNNPVKFVDPTGKDVRVKRLDDGTYEVIGGTLNDDKNIYVYTPDKNGDYNVKGGSIGESLTEYSFFSENGVAVNGAIINPGDNSGADFLNKEIIGGNPSLSEYVPNARNEKTYDFKDRGIDDRGSQTKDQYRYRGMPLNEASTIVGSDGKTVVYGSARDVGNVGAGYVAGRNGLTWQEARSGFDTYQSWSSSKLWPPKIVITTEGQPTQRAERVGWGNGNAAYWMNKTRRK